MMIKKSKVKRVVVTGGWGFIGARFVLQLLKETPYTIRVIDSATYASDQDRVYKDLPTEYQVRVEKITKDICDVKPHDLAGAEYIVNFAAESHVDNSIKDGRPFIRSNIEGVFNLLEASKKVPGLKKFVHISTDEVYGDMADLKGNQSADESFTLRPSSYYSSTKASADLIVQSAHRTFDIPYIITRSCNNFGPGQHDEKFLPTIFKSIKEGTPIPVYGDGRQIREWIHVDDNVREILHLMRSENIINEVINIGSGIHYRNTEVIKLIGKYLDKKPLMEFVEDRLGHDRVYKLDCAKLHKFTGDRIYTPLEVFLRDEARKANDSTNGR